MINTFDGSILCSDCGQYSLRNEGTPEHWTCTNCNSKFHYMVGFGVQRISDRSPVVIVINIKTAPEPEQGFFLEGSL